jgi:hypothetical protein
LSNIGEPVLLTKRVRRSIRNATIDSPPNGTPAARLAELQQLHAAGLISDADFEAKKAEILSGI